MSRPPETPPGVPTTNIYEDATLRPHASAPASVTGLPPARPAAQTTPKSQSQLADEKRAEARRSGVAIPPARPDPAPSAPPAEPAGPPSQSVVQPPAPTVAPTTTASGAAKKPDPRAPYDPAKAMRERNAREAAPPPPMTLQQRVAAKRTYLRPEKKLLRDED